MRFPDLRYWENGVEGLAQGSQIAGLDPTRGPGSLLLLEDTPSMPDPHWSRPIYALRRGLEVMCGYLEKNGRNYAVLSGASGEIKARFHTEDLGHLSRVTGVAVPV